MSISKPSGRRRFCSVVFPLPRHAVRWVFLGTLLAVLLVQIPGLGNIDTSRRLQVTRSFWTSEPPVRSGDDPRFGVTGRNGVIHAWYGLGQSALMLPADVIASLFERIARDAAGKLKIRSVVVATLTFPLLNAVTIALVFLWLRLEGFDPEPCFWGALALLFGTTFLHYSQEHMENSLEIFLLVADCACLRLWFQTGRSLFLGLAAATVACAALVRLPDLAGHAGPWGTALWAVWSPASAPLRPDLRRWAGFKRMAMIGIPIVLLGFAADRAYHFHRFGSWRGTYIHIYATEAKARHPELGADFPFDSPFSTGFAGPFIAPNRSMFLFDPLAALLVLTLSANWRAIPSKLKVFILSTGAGLLTVIAFYARYHFWDGADAWADRYTLGPLQLMLVPAVPLFLAYRSRSPRWLRVLGAVLIAAAVMVQILSVAMPSAVEEAQGHSDGVAHFVIFSRLKNLISLSAGHPCPTNVPSGLWRLNLAPATLSGNSAAIACLLWAAWGVVAVGAYGCFQKAWRLLSPRNQTDRCSLY